MPRIVILRTSRSVQRGNDRIPIGPAEAPGTDGPADLKVESADVSEKDRFDVQKDPQVHAAAPEMPVRLIHPASQPGTAAAVDPPAVSWGITAVGADRSGFTGQGVRVAVLDTGIDPKYAEHPAFKGVQVVSKNFTLESDGDEHGHGTHCAGTIVGRDVNGCRIGVARGVTDLLVGKVLGRAGGGTTAGIIEGIMWAYQKGADVISMSLGMDFVSYRDALVRNGYEDTQATAEALSAFGDNLRLFDRLAALVLAGVVVGNRAEVPGAVVVVAAGNESRRSKGLVVRAGPPGASAPFIPVAALDPHEVQPGRLGLADFSNRGAQVTAPGVDIWSAALGGGLRPDSGTSMAAPHVAGVTALYTERLIRQRGRGRFRAEQVAQELFRSAAPLPHLHPDDGGWGKVQAPPA